MLVAVAAPPAAGAQDSCTVPRRCAVSPRPGVDDIAPLPAPGAGIAPRSGPSPERALLLSAVLPGAGQYAQGQHRWVAYLAAEVVGWLLVIDRRRDGNRLRDRYRDLAWTVAREGLSGPPRTDGSFEYYEDLSDWERSGRYDRDPRSAGLQPEDDPATFNGAVWGLARALYFPPDGPDPEPGDPRYQEALEYYRTRAYDATFLWDWSGAPEEWARYGRTIEHSDERFRQATLFTGAVVANHLLSSVDAFVSARLTDAAGRDAGLVTRLRPGPPGAGTGARLDLTFFLHPGEP